MPGSMDDSHIWYRYLRTNVNLFFATGLVGFAPPWFASKSKLYQLLWHVYRYLNDFLLYFITVTNFIGTVLLTDVFDICASLPPLIHGMQLSGRQLILQWQREACYKYIDELNELLLEDEQNPIAREPTFREVHRSDFLMNQRLTWLELVSLLVSNSLFFLPECIKSFINPDEAHVTIVSWYPYDTKIAAYKQITNTIHSVSWLLINVKLAAADTFFQSLFILHASQFKQLNRFFLHIFDTDRAEMRPGGPEKDIRMNAELRWWIKQHQRTLSATKKLQELCSPLLFFSYGECVINMCLGAFLLTVDSAWTVMQRFAAFVIIGTIFVQMFVMCRLGDYVQKTSVSVAELSFSVLRANYKIRRSFLMIISRLRLPAKFSALKLFFIDSKHYGTLVQVVFSYYTTLRQIQSRSSEG